MRRWHFAAAMAARRRFRDRAGAARWTPVMLRWSKPRMKLSRAAHANTRVAAVSGTWHSHVHLHVSPSLRYEVTRVGKQGTHDPAQGRAAGPPAIPTPANRLHAATHLQTLVYARTHGASLRTITSPARHVSARAGLSTVSGSPGSAPARPSMQRTRARSTLPPAGRANAPAARIFRARNPAVAPRPGVTPTGTEKMSHPSPLARTWRSRGVERPVSAPTKPPIDFVFRTSTAGAASAAAVSGVDAHPGSPASRHAAATPSAPANAGRPAGATALDPSLVERVAADVIRRIDQRARIELERRGM
jgi:hypothetical protein